ncbi:6-carboxy-5,6,7,8-tetrahydropterin synthase [bacterium HR37]|nr:6-carboxy-5,6,7,8-tetrahydropterin synthase [bacterium HR37]
MEKEVCTLTRVYRFSAAHRLHSPRYSDEENRRIFGKCNNPKGHGHDYYIEVTVTGNIDSETGMIVSVDYLDRVVKEIIDELDHKRLDIEVPYFMEFQPSGENIVKYLWLQLEQRIKGVKLFHLKLWETRDNYFEFFKEE